MLYEARMDRALGVLCQHIDHSPLAPLKGELAFARILRK